MTGRIFQSHEIPTALLGILCPGILKAFASTIVDAILTRHIACVCVTRIAESSTNVSIHAV